MRINKVSIVIESVDEENASVKLITDPTPGEDEEIEDTPAVLLGSGIWDVVQEYLDNVAFDGAGMGSTLQ